MENVTVQVTDNYGGTITASKDRLTGYIMVEVMSGRTGETEAAYLDPNDEVAIAWIKEVFPPIHCDILFGTCN